MDIKQFKYFLKVAENGNLSKSARELFISQQALSKSIIKLEEELGAQLFERTYNGMRLSDTGKIFEPYARKMTIDYEESLNAILAFQHKARLQIKMGFVIGCYNHLSAIDPKLLYQYEQDNPNVSIIIREDGPKKIIIDLERHDIDLAYIVTDSIKDIEKYGHCVLRKDPIYILSARNVIKKESVNFSEIRNLPVLVGNIGEKPEESIRSFYEEAGYEPILKEYNGNFIQCAERVRCKEGIMVAGLSFLRGIPNENLKLTPFPDISKKMYHCLLWNKSDTLSPKLSGLIDLICGK
ncbi:MAG: LysR family transcriptional regulator [Erysipelotrichaceae bacterium]